MALTPNHSSRFARAQTEPPMETIIEDDAQLQITPRIPKARNAVPYKAIKPLRIGTSTAVQTDLMEMPVALRKPLTTSEISVPPFFSLRSFYDTLLGGTLIALFIYALHGLLPFAACTMGLHGQDAGSSSYLRQFKKLGCHKLVPELTSYAALCLFFLLGAVMMMDRNLRATPMNKLIERMLLLTVLVALVWLGAEMMEIEFSGFDSVGFRFGRLIEYFGY